MPGVQEVGTTGTAGVKQSMSSQKAVVYGPLDYTLQRIENVIWSLLCFAPTTAVHSNFADGFQ